MNIEVKKKTKHKNPISRLFAKVVLKLIGWKVDFKIPEEKKFLLISEPHTSNWDLPLMLIISIVIGRQLNWAAKDNLFKGLHGKYLRWLGGIPVNRRSRTKFTDQIIEIFNKSEKLIFVIAPSGTRSFTEFWKSGFYHIANGAKIPIAFGFLDYGNKVGGIKPGFLPSGNMEEDFKLIRKFYDGMKGKIPENFGPIRFQESKEKDS
ncbi:MAG: glycerol acyltransferase [Calditrichaeota bacterium]|nr:MAG: glycerol acyltransferase [Calditrichota bacterium]MBL1205291.1 glycerol acyltransferase [Calditrichota bacterium]NOG45120.1 glycerol acyltransferase [Calditrichota bacterium]